MKFFRYGITIVTLLVFIYGTVDVCQLCNKVISTSIQLMILNDNATFYNQQERKTDKMTEDYLANDAKRQEIYNSEDDVIRWFSNQNAFIKMCGFLIGLATYPLLLLMWTKQIILQVRRMRRRQNYKNKQYRKRHRVQVQR